MGWLRAPRSILGHTLLLVIGTGALLTALNLWTILVRPPPRDMPVSAYEVSRLLKGETIAKASPSLRTGIAEAAPDLGPGTGSDGLVRLAVAHQLGLAPEEVRLRRVEEHHPGHGQDATQERRELATYGLERFDPVIFGAFTAAARLPDGRWRVVWRGSQDTLRNWQLGTTLRILLSLLIVLAVAWLFGTRLARPIRAFAEAAERVGRQQQVEPVEVRGPAEIMLAAAAVNDMQTRIGRYVAERTSVIGALAHDLRTPLSRLNFHLISAPEPLRVKAEADIIEMERMIASTLEFVENDRRARPSEAVDLALLVEGVVDDLADLGRDVKLESAASATILGDAVLLRRLFSNLINNAVTYGVRAAVRMERGDGEVTVEISDEGPGLAPADLERAFEPFYRVETSRSRATGGMGLGLAIVKAAAERHGGSVALANRPEGGLRVRVVLPTL